MADTDERPSLRPWQRRALHLVLPVGFTMGTLWSMWFLMTLLDGAMTWGGVIQTVFGIVASAGLVLVGTAYRKVLGEQ